ncbi:MAG: hypothetical protein DRN68_06070 [Thaumarchaeota archaeon]|nr:MAG: hypothetical protein DRN68_06070 [Nitrososphaerota archaeon]
MIQLMITGAGKEFLMAQTTGNSKQQPLKHQIRWSAYFLILRITSSIITAPLILAIMDPITVYSDICRLSFINEGKINIFFSDNLEEPGINSRLSFYIHFHTFNSSG